MSMTTTDSVIFLTNLPTSGMVANQDNVNESNQSLNVGLIVVGAIFGLVIMAIIAFALSRFFKPLKMEVKDQNSFSKHKVSDLQQQQSRPLSYIYSSYQGSPMIQHYGIPTSLNVLNQSCLTPQIANLSFERSEQLFMNTKNEYNRQNPWHSQARHSFTIRDQPQNIYMAQPMIHNQIQRDSPVQANPRLPTPSFIFSDYSDEDSATSKPFVEYRSQRSSLPIISCDAESDMWINHESLKKYFNDSSIYTPRHSIESDNTLTRKSKKKISTENLLDQIQQPPNARYVIILNALNSELKSYVRNSRASVSTSKCTVSDLSTIEEE
ncbi:hypothetical protein HK096_005629 [Nowakowskiella sp. JEL0078]|nr:hypothetical protein HK096_005629 [Nowakowskiella sp. JEL0078]